MPESELYNDLTKSVGIVYCVLAIASCVLYRELCKIKKKRPSKVMQVLLFLGCFSFYTMSERLIQSIVEEVTAIKIVGLCIPALCVIVLLIISTISVIKAKRECEDENTLPALNLENADESSDDKKHYKITWGGDKPYTYEELYIYDVWLDDD